MNKELALKYLTNTATKNEISLFESWLGESELNKNKYNEFVKSWDELSININQFHPDTEEAWQKVSEKLSPAKTDKTKTYYIFRWQSIAAVIILLIAIGFFISKQLRPLDIFKTYTTYVTTDSIKNIILVDGSKISLNKNSELKIPEWHNKRDVYLKGEAYFEVARDTLKPFLVKTNYTTTKVLGTSFNIKNTDENDIVSLITGKVEFYTNRQKRNSIILGPGEESFYYNENKEIGKNRFENKNFLAWKTGEIYFNNTPFSSVITTITDYYGLHVADDIQNNNQYTLTSCFNNMPIDKVLSILELTWNAEISIKNDTIYFSFN
ncbi:MAG: FecR family protein [Bacteroidales bacterium]|nr:FecR family protein [Bacteroidales bacterium]